MLNSDKENNLKNFQENHRKRATYIRNIVVPALVFGSISGFVTALAVMLYKKCAGYLIHYSEVCYDFMREHLYIVPLALVVLFGVAYVLSLIYKKSRNLRGGGIPTTVGFLRGIFDFHWVTNLFGVFALSLTSFFIGVPLGNEGPSVQMGASIGKGAVDICPKRNKAWSRYSMTAGACAGFTTATGAPVSGIMFAIEDAHRRITPMILMVSFTSVVVSYFTSLALSPILKVSPRLFTNINLKVLEIKDFWLPLMVGVIMGIVAVLILKYYKFLSKFFSKILVKVPSYVKIFACLTLTLVFGLISINFISTGHHLTVSLFDIHNPVWFLLLILLVRSTLTLSASANGITGGLFLPIISLGAVASAAIAEVAIKCGLDGEYYSLILMLGISACIGGVMKTPLTAIVFAIEALYCFNSILPVITAVTISYGITEIFDVKSITDAVLDHRIKGLKKEGAPRVLETKLKIKPKSFVVGKQIRDILWPYNCFVLSSKRAHKHERVMDESGDRSMKIGDTLVIRFSSFNEKEAIEQLKELLGDQEVIVNQVEEP